MLLLGGVDVRRGHGAVTLEDGRRMEVRTVSVETRHVLEFDERDLPAESRGQLHEGDSYIIRWTYTLEAQGGRPPLISYSLVQQKQKLGQGLSLSAAEAGRPEDDSRGAGRSSAVFLWRGRRSRFGGRDGAALQSSSHQDSQVRLKLLPSDIHTKRGRKPKHSNKLS